MSKAPEIDSKHYWKGYKIKLYPTDSQKEFIDRCIDLSRFVYNWALGKQIEIYEDYKNGKSKKRKYSNYDLDKMLSEFRNKPENNWLLDLPLTAGRYQIRHLNEGYNLFLRKKEIYLILNLRNILNLVHMLYEMSVCIFKIVELK